MKIPSPWIDKVLDKEPPTEKELELLSIHWQEEAEANSRLGCQVGGSHSRVWRMGEREGGGGSCRAGGGDGARGRCGSPWHCVLGVAEV